jgi:hypothetical protein
MPTIFVETDNSNPDPEKKLYRAARAGGAAFKAEEKMQKVVKKVVDKAPDFTTVKSAQAKGYALRLSLAKVEIAKPDTKCSLSGEILRYPLTVSKKRGAGYEMVSTAMTGSATASGTSEHAILDCVEAIAEDLVAKSLKYMRIDFARR